MKKKEPNQGTSALHLSISALARSDSVSAKMYAHLFQRGKKLITHPMHQTSAGFFMGGEPYLLIEDHSATAIGAAVRAALAAYRTGIRTPLRHEYSLLPVSPLQKEMVGYRGARLVDIEKKEQFSLFPQLNGGGKGANRGYHEL